MEVARGSVEGAHAQGNVEDTRGSMNEAKVVWKR